MSAHSGALRATIRRHPRLAAVTIGYLAALTAYGLATGARLTVSYALIVGAAIVAVGVADERVRFSMLVLVGLSAWGAAHLAGGLIQLDGDGDRILYNGMVTRWIHLDNVVHLFGFGTAGIACWEATRSWLVAVPGHRIGRGVVTALFGMGVGAANEVVEFAASHLLGATNVGGYQNTGRDLVANLLGSGLAGVIVARRTEGADGGGGSRGGDPG